MIRKIHLDFHTARDVKDVGAAFDPEQFADTLARAHVNFLATPGKCQYGHFYFDAKTGQPHPGLVRPDLFPETVRACVRRGIRVQAYFTLGLDDVAAEAHPDWRQRYRDGTYAAWGAKHICFASPHIDEVVIPQVWETIKRCPGLCGFWFDICLYLSGAFYSPAFERVARERIGSEADDAQRWLLGRQVIRESVQRLDAAIRQRLPQAENYYNSLAVPGEAHNIRLQPMQEVEHPLCFSHPEKLTTQVRWYRPFGSPVISLVSRFQGPWMDPGTLRTPDQIRFDLGRSVALGCHVSMGDHRHPDGTLDPLVYERIGAVFGELKQCEAWLDDACPLREAVLLTEIDRSIKGLFPDFPPLTYHAARLLEEIGLQFDIASVEDDLPPADLIVWPGQQPASPALAARLRQHAAQGGALLATDASLTGLEDLFGARTQREVSDHFFRPTGELDVGAFRHIITGPVRPIEAAGNAVVLAELLPNVSATPPCPGHTPVGPALIQRGRLIYSAAPLFAESLASGSAFLRTVLSALCDRLLPGRLVRHSGGSSVAAHLHRAPPGYALHLLHWAVERARFNFVGEAPTLGPIEVQVRLGEMPQRIVLEPSGESLEFRSAGGITSFRVPRLRVHQLVGITTV